MDGEHNRPHLPHVTLRRASVEDAPAVSRWRSEPSTARFQPIQQHPIAQVEAMLAERASFAIGSDVAGKFQWIVEHHNTPVGWVSLDITPPQRRHAIGALGYTVGETYRGRGFGRAGVGALLPIAFGHDAFNLERLEAVAAVENIASRRVLEGNGFRHEGILRGLLIIGGVRVDHAMYGLLRTDWEPTCADE